LLVFRTYKKL